MKRLRHRMTRNDAPLWAAALSVLVHLVGAAGLSQIELPRRPPPEVDEVLQVAFVARGDEPGDKETAPAPAEPAEAVEPPTPRVAQVETPPAPPVPEVVSAPPAPDVPPGPDVRFPALHRSKQPTPTATPVRPPSYAAWRAARTAAVIPNRIPDGGGDPNGQDAIDSEGRDRCEPQSGRQVEALYLLFDASGSMTDMLRAQALSCAQQYARAVIDGGGTVVVGSFARRSEFTAPTRDMIDVAVALRKEVGADRTILPGRALKSHFDRGAGFRADLVILSDGQIPNLFDVLPWYRYFLESNEENRGYLYTLGVPGHPDVTSALRDAGFDVFVYRIL